MGKIGELLGVPLGWVMYWIYELVNNYGVSIILFTLLTRVIMLPMTYKQQISTIRTQALAPRVNQLRKQYANNQQKFQEEQQKLYNEEGVSSTGSCLSLIITMIILYGVLDVVYRPLTHILRVSSDFIDKAKSIILENEFVTEKVLRTRPELTIMHQIKEHPEFFSNIDTKDSQQFFEKISSFKNTFLGIDLGTIPTIKPEVWNKTAIALVMVPVISGVVQLLSTLYSQYRTRKMNKDAPKMQGAGCMNAMLYGMPIFSVWLAFSVPAGVGFYWIWSSVFAFLTMFLIYMYFTPERIEEVNAKLKEKNKNKKPGFMQKMLEQQNQLMKEQGMGRSDYNSDTEGMSRSEKQNYNRKLINEARKRMAEKYGEEYIEDENDSES